jgi:ABC-type transporter Mla subunit MlaD
VGAAAGQVGGQPYRMSDREVEQIIRRVEKQADKFRKSLDSALDKSRLNGSQREDNINQFVKDYYRETARLHDRFNHHESTSSDVEAVLDRASQIEDFMRRYPLTTQAQNDWSTLKVNLEELAGAYNVTWRRGIFTRGPVVSGVPYRISDNEVEKIIHRVESQSDKFRSSLDSALDKSRLNGTREEDEINAFVKSFNQATKRLHEHFDDHKSTSSDVQSVLDGGAQINDFMRRNRLTSKAQNDWSTLKGNLDELARVYNVSWRWQWRR